MTATPLKELFAKVPALNNPNEPITFEVDGDKLVAKWDVVRAKSLYPKEFKTIDKKFSVTVDFDEKKGTFKTKDREKNSGATIGMGGISFGSNSFSGKKNEKSFSFELGGINKKDGENVSPVLAWSFDTARIKGPLFAFLEQNGWTKHKGLFG